MEIINLDIAVGEIAGESYPVSAYYPPLGTETEHRTIDTDSELLASSLQWANESSSVRRSSIEAAETLGSALYDTLFGGKLGIFLDKVLQYSETQETGVRLRLSSGDPSIVSLPWEFLFHPQTGRLFATDQTSMLTRYLSHYATFGRTRSLAAELPLRMLMVVPAVPDLDTTAEIERVRLAIEPEEDSQPTILMTVLGGPDEIVPLPRLLDTLQNDEQGFDILHFVGHGVSRGSRAFVRFNAAAGGETWLDSGVFARSLKPYALNQLRLAVLNTCESGARSATVRGVTSLAGLAPDLIRNGFAAVIGMQYSVLDSASLEFSQAFYRALTCCDTTGQVDAAITDARGRLATRFQGHRSFATPVLFLHTEDGHIFEFPSRDSEETPRDEDASSSDPHLGFARRLDEKSEQDSLDERAELNTEMASLKAKLRYLRSRRTRYGVRNRLDLFSEIVRTEERIEAIERRLTTTRVP
ncbi:MAG: CHAT domain-containing protein [Chloroflexota bacterium]|nr:CHAT domain-containing protein [Chloroflexota bacterium]